MAGNLSFDPSKYAGEQVTPKGQHHPLLLTGEQARKADNLLKLAYGILSAGLTMESGLDKSAAEDFRIQYRNYLETSRGHRSE